MRGLITILFFLAGIAVLVIIFFVILKNIAVLSEENSKLKITLSNLLEFAQIQHNLSNDYKAVSGQQLEKLKEFLPEEPDNEALLISLAKLAKEREIILDSADFVEERVGGNPPPGKNSGASEGVSAMLYFFNFSAKYGAFRSFLSALENNLRLIDVVEISFNPKEKDIYKFSLKVKSYYKK